MNSYFNAPKRYFLSHSVGCQLKTTPEFVGTVFFDSWKDKGGNAWPDWLGILDGFRAELATYLGADKASICPQVNVSSALTKILYSLPKAQNRPVIVLSPQDFPTIGFVLKQAERRGYELRFVDGDITDIENWEKAIDERTHVVHITHAISNTGQLLPVEPICKLAKKNGAISIVDIAQSVGIVPIDLAQWDADFAIGTSVKFLCGGPGACFLYANPSILPSCKPIDVGWFSHENPFEMDIQDFRYAPDALRFLGGTPSPMPLAAALNALQFWNEVGADKASIAAQARLDTLSSVIPDSALISPRESNLRGGTLCVAPPNRAQLRQALGKHDVEHDERNEGFRFSVHGYTTDEDIEVLKHIFETVFFETGF